MSLVEATGLKYAYPDGHFGANGVTFAMELGETVGLVGANGAGKSTLLLMLAGVLLPTEGTLTVGGVPLGKKTVQAVRAKAGLVFQDADDQLFSATVAEDVAFGPRNLNLSEEEVQARVERALALTGMGAFANRAPYRLSGGEKRSAAIAAVLAMEPELLLMDEPSASMDPKARRRLINLLPELPQAKLIASHDLDMIWDVCTRVIVLKAGAVAADGPAREILRDAALLDACGLELPLRLQG